MNLPHDIHRCLGWRAEDETISPGCVDCERRLAGIEDYLHGGRRILWMAPTMADPCPEQLLSKGAKR